LRCDCRNTKRQAGDVCLCGCRFQTEETEGERGAPMWFTSEPSLRMSSFKTKIRRRKYALSRGSGSSGGGPPPRNVSGETARSSSRDAAPEWEFVNFNPVMYGRGGRPPALLTDAGLVTAAPALPPRELPPPMPPPRPPPLCTPASPEWPRAAATAAGTVSV
jgi:hypothetical protein